MMPIKKFEVGDTVRLKPKEEIESIVQKYWPNDPIGNINYIDGIMELKNNILTIESINHIAIKDQYTYYLVTDKEIAWTLLQDYFDSCSGYIDYNIPDLFGV